jgi:hypothetical protein
MNKLALTEADAYSSSAVTNIISLRKIKEGKDIPVTGHGGP